MNLDQLNIDAHFSAVSWIIVKPAASFENKENPAGEKHWSRYVSSSRPMT